MKNTQLWLIGSNAAINLQDPAAAYYLKPPIEGLVGLPGIRTSEGLNVGANGGWTGPQKYNPRLIMVPVMIAHADIAEVETKRRNLVSLLSEKRLLLKYVTEAGNVYTTNVVVLDAPTPLQQLLNRVDMKINLKADDPLLYDYGSGSGIVATLTVMKPSDGFAIPFEVPLFINGSGSYINVENTGTTAVDPIIKIYGPVHEPTVVNQTTNQQMQILVDLAAGETIEINTQIETITRDGLDIYYLKSEESEFINIAPGVNKMYMTSNISDDAGYAEVRFSSGYIGI